MRITANQVTLARLLLMPGLCAFIYGDEQLQLMAVILGTLIGCTDFVDGWLARKHGPTVLGGLMDPIADKVFIAVCFVPFAHRGYVPWELVAALFLREYLVTALRSSFEQRQRQLKSTWLSKMKTWVQMTALGLIMLMLVVHSRTALLAVFWGFAALPAVGGIAFRLIKGRVWRGSLVGALAHGSFAVIFQLWGAEAAAVTLMAFAVGITWVSAWDYVAAARAVIQHPTPFDASRLVPAIALPIAAMASLELGGAPPWAVIGVLGLEFAVGGLDNLLAHHGAAPSPGAWAGRVLIAAGAFALMPLLPDQALPLGALALAVCTIGTAVTFWTRRRFYLEAKLRDKKRVAAEPA